MKWREITLGQAAQLRRVLSRHASPDPYVRSPAYFALTGRRGLWLVSIAGGATLVCRHPNASGTMLIFPPLGANGDQLLIHLLQTMPRARLARMPYAEADRVVQLSRGALCASTEATLDWRFPVHTLNTQRIVALDGGAFRKTRARVRQISALGVIVRPLTLTDRVPALCLVHEWTGHKGQDLPRHELVAPYRRAFAMLAEPSFQLQGLAFEHEGQLVGFTLWERPVAHGPACELISLASRRLPGLAEFQLHAECAELVRQGVASVCIGGSETAGLDAFKRKFQPEQSAALTTLAMRATPLVAQELAA